MFDFLDEGINVSTQYRENSARYGRRAIATTSNQTQHSVPNKIIPSEKATNQISEDFLEQSWTSLNIFNRKQKGRLTNKQKSK